MCILACIICALQHNATKSQLYFMNNYDELLWFADRAMTTVTTNRRKVNEVWNCAHMLYGCVEYV